MSSDKDLRVRVFHGEQFVFAQFRPRLGLVGRLHDGVRPDSSEIEAVAVLEGHPGELARFDLEGEERVFAAGVDELSLAVQEAVVARAQRVFSVAILEVDESVFSPRDQLVTLQGVVFTRQMSVLFAIDVAHVDLRVDGQVDGPPLGGCRRLLVAAQPVVLAAEIEVVRQVANRPLPRASEVGLVIEILNRELLVGPLLLRLAGHVALLVSGQIPAQVTSDVDDLLPARVVLQGPQLLLAQRRCRGVDLEAERLRREVFAVAVDKTDLPFQWTPIVFTKTVDAVGERHSDGILQKHRNMTS